MTFGILVLKDVGGHGLALLEFPTALTLQLVSAVHVIPDCRHGKLISPLFQSHLAADQRAVFKGAVDNLNSQLGGCIQWRTCLPTDKDYVLVIPGTGK